MPVSSWSTTPADNDDADATSGIALAENQAPSQINDSIRAIMAVIKGDLANNLGGAGYQKLPNGLILQWWQASNPLTDYFTTFPIAFPNAVRGVLTSIITPFPANQFFAASWDGATTSGVNIRTRFVSNGGGVGVAGSLTVQCFAVGH